MIRTNNITFHPRLNRIITQARIQTTISPTINIIINRIKIIRTINLTYSILIKSIKSCSIIIKTGAIHMNPTGLTEMLHHRIITIPNTTSIFLVTNRRVTKIQIQNRINSR